MIIAVKIVATVIIAENIILQKTKRSSSKEGYVASISINVNGDNLDIVNDFLEKSRPIGLSVTTILQLQAGDRVQVLFSADANGEILAEASLTNFQAARFPSPM
ncbi:hypothetical protein KEH51_04940 [[Brevibacterium] frigoritolerans]|uniref:Uncharacterized protein n=1 Tax=Peribacillus frigoritolerans TaxID=450367 RepID=A0A941J255_9BACI|nr:hypothetical protein [Peribacillus frigoritolerans]